LPDQLRLALVLLLCGQQTVADRQPNSKKCKHRCNTHRSIVDDLIPLGIHNLLLKTSRAFSLFF
jgi:hypothetical protein